MLNGKPRKRITLGRNSSDILLGKGRTLLKWADQLLIKMLGDVWWTGWVRPHRLLWLRLTLDYFDVNLFDEGKTLNDFEKHVFHVHDISNVIPRFENHSPENNILPWCKNNSNEREKEPLKPTSSLRWKSSSCSHTRHDRVFENTHQWWALAFVRLLNFWFHCPPFSPSARKI